MLITITGIDGCGKGTQVQCLVDYLEQGGRRVFVSKAYGPREKEVFSHYIERANDLAVMFLFQALHAEQRVRAEKAIADGAIVIADRWDDAYHAYHGKNGILAQNPKLREQINTLAFGGLRPDITFLLRVPVKVAMERCSLRGPDFFDKKSEKYHQSLSESLDALALELGWSILDGTKPYATIHEEIVSITSKIL